MNLMHVCLFLGITSCGPQLPAYTADAAFRPALETWKKAVWDAGLQPKHYFSVQFGTLSDNADAYTLATCTIPGHVIIVSKPMWDSLGPLSRKYLMWHEAGHCAFDLNHASQTTTSIMTPRQISEADYNVNRKQLEIEYIDRIKDVDIFSNE